MTSGSQTPGRRWILGVCAALAILSAFHRAGPDVGSRAGLNSDEAVAQLMANAPRLDPYASFFWGQDRLGGWPFILAWTLHKATGLAWTGAGIYWLLVACWVSVIWPVWRLAGRWGLVGLAFVLGEVAVDHDVRVFAFSISQPYAWQLSTFFWAWWLLRCSADLERAFPGGAGRRGSIAVAALVCCLLTVWISPLSAGFLWVAALGEVRRSPSGVRRGPLSWRLLGTVVLSVGLEELIRVGYQRFSAARHWRINWTAAAFDAGHYAQNVSAVWAQLVERGTWAIPVVALPLALAGFAVERRPKPPGEVDRSSQPGLLAAACVVMAWLNVVVVVATSWARLNQYNPRYLVPSWIFWTLACVWGAAGIVEGLAPAALRAGRSVLSASAWLILAGVAIAMPRVANTETLRAQALVAEVLPQRAPDGILLGCYWGAYVFVDGGAAHALTPIIYHNGTQRMPWTDARLRTAPEVLVSHDGCPATGTADDPARFIFDHGVLLELNEPHWLVEGPFAFSRYVNRTAWLFDSEANHDGESEPRMPNTPRLRAPDPNGRGEAMTVDVPAGARELLLLFEDRRGYGVPSLVAEEVDNTGETTPAAVQVGANIVSVALRGATAPEHVRLSYAAKGTRDSLLLGVAIEPGR